MLMQTTSYQEKLNKRWDCYKCHKEVGAVSRVLKIKEPHKRPYNEVFCRKCARGILSAREE